MRAKQTAKTNQNFKSHFLDTFWGEMGEEWCLCFNASYFTYFWYGLCWKLTKSLALQGFEEIFTPCKTTYQSRYTTFLFSHFLQEWNLLGFFSLYKTPKRGLFIKNWLLLKVWTSSKLSALILLKNIKPLFIMAWLK